MTNHHLSITASNSPLDLPACAPSPYPPAPVISIECLNESCNAYVLVLILLLSKARLVINPRDQIALSPHQPGSFQQALKQGNRFTGPGGRQLTRSHSYATI
jgi:hypothetical protein